MQLHTRFRSLATTLIVLAIAGLAFGCPSTFHYRTLQSEFIEAAHADNQASVDPLSASTADASYASIAAELTPERIAELDPKLRGNAWVIRSYSHWRSGRYRDAIASADIGLKTDGVGPRDRILLQLLPALAVDSEAKDLWVAKNRTLTAADYAPFKQAFTQAYGEIRKAESLVDANTAPSTTYYIAYHQWRIVTNWNIVIASVDKDAVVSPARSAARADAEKVVGEELSRKADAARDKIPDWHPLRQLIKAQGG
jgi:hypothetical protein